jgi:hypothetical protein
VALEGSGNAWEIAWILEPHVARVVVVRTHDTGIRQARAKTNRLDARALARLVAAGGRLAAEPSHPGGGGVDTGEQRVAVVPGRAGHDDLAVAHEAALSQRQKLIHDFWEIAGQRPVVAAAQVDLTVVPECEAPKAVPLRLVQMLAARQRVGATRERGSSGGVTGAPPGRE